MIRTYVDAGVLIAAVTGRQPLVQPVAIAVLDDPHRTFVASPFLRLEVLPKAVYHRNSAEIGFYEAFFAAVSAWAESGVDLIAAAEAEAARSGLGALDALHVTAATTLGAEELVTTERPGRPLHRVTRIRVVSIHPSATGTARA